MAYDETNQDLGKKSIEEQSTINRIIQEISLNVSKPDFMEFVYDMTFG